MTAGSDVTDESAPSMPARHLALEGCVNFRDLGGYATTSGTRLRWRRLFRADGLSSLTPRDLALVRALGIATVIDLRTRTEAEERGSFPVGEVPVAYHSLPVMDVLPAPEELATWDEPRAVAAGYLDMVKDGGESLAGAIRLLAAEGGLPAVVHCSAGKDRTGVLSALVLAFLGVPDDVIAADYARSGLAMTALLERLRTRYAEAGDALERYAPAILHAAPETMLGFLASVRETYGGVDGLADALGLTATVPLLGRALLEEAR